MNELFVFDDEQSGFESLVNANGDAYWYASDLARMLGYDNYRPFQKAVQKAMTACVTLEISMAENFQQEQRTVGGEEILDYRLSRFACYLTSINADISKPRVAEAQTYFLTLAEAFRQYVQGPDNVERVLVRDQLSQHEKSLSGAAQQAGVTSYALFQDKGYRGLYNMSLGRLKQYKGYIGNRPLLDFMGETELAANLFRITQTKEKIRKENIKGQKNLEDTAFNVGQKVRKTMREINGTRPEDLPLVEDRKQLAAV
uniref:DNA-damage-inducible protein D n=1 Tax=Candidatus Kentrum sp. FM TaxID=2126340 RepID=A0A450SU30_9GAMM|nr:MAG: DNA-damage-inducible protein D [Candidatus Kentron sp. FM]VFJ57806.1 MAG: DNA-damage-inducible protein D [Candidatus Kentron sp. FM]VFK11604.1 MAG: DNA-damage-inducible protein D [Candidatus Kentron sp. FM]